MKDIHLGNFILSLIQTVGLMIPVLILFYKQGRKDQILDETVKDLSGLKKKLDEARDVQAQVLTELKSQIEKVNNILTKVTVVMEYIQKDVEELKRR